MMQFNKFHERSWTRQNLRGNADGVINTEKAWEKIISRDNKREIRG